MALNGNRRDIDQTVTPCAFCHQCSHLDQVAAMVSGVLMLAAEVAHAPDRHVGDPLLDLRAQSP